MFRSKRIEQLLAEGLAVSKECLSISKECLDAVRERRMQNAIADEQARKPWKCPRETCDVVGYHAHVIIESMEK